MDWKLNVNLVGRAASFLGGSFPLSRSPLDLYRVVLPFWDKGWLRWNPSFNLLIMLPFDLSALIGYRLNIVMASK